MPVTILGKGSSLIGGTIKAKLRRGQVEQVLEGFFPRCRQHGPAAKGRARAGFRKWACPTRPMPAITRHLARFLRQQAPASIRPARTQRPRLPHACPVQRRRLHAPFVRERLLAVLNGWLAEKGFPAFRPLAAKT